MSLYLLDRPVVFLGACGCLVAVTVNGEDLSEFVRDHRGYRMEVMGIDEMRALPTWCGRCQPEEAADA